MHPEVRHDLLRFGQLDHVPAARSILSCRRGTSAMPPISRSARPVDRIKWMVARVSHRWHCTSSPIPAVEALPDRRRRLRRAAVTFRSDRLGFGLGAIGLADGLLGARARLPGEFWRLEFGYRKGPLAI